jgi:hypothetical protein
MKPVKLQIVVDPLIAESLARLPGKTKTDKIRWALCVYREVLRGRRDHMQQIMNLAGERYRNAVVTVPKVRG